MNPKLVDIVATVLGVDPTILHRNSNGETVDGWDSLKHWAIIADVESTFGVDFTMDEAVTFQTLGDLHDALEARGAVGAS